MRYCYKETINDVHFNVDDSSLIVYPIAIPSAYIMRLYDPSC